MKAISNTGNGGDDSGCFVGWMSCSEEPRADDVTRRASWQYRSEENLKDIKERRKTRICDHAYATDLLALFLVSFPASERTLFDVSVSHPCICFAATCLAIHELSQHVLARWSRISPMERVIRRPRFLWRTCPSPTSSRPNSLQIPPSRRPRFLTMRLEKH